MLSNALPIRVPESIYKRQYDRVFAFVAKLVAVMVTLVVWCLWFAVSLSLLLLSWVRRGSAPNLQLGSAPEMWGRTMGLQGVVNGTGLLVDESEVGTIANALGIGITIGLNAGVVILLILMVMALTPLVKRHTGVKIANSSGTPISSPTCAISASDRVYR